MRALVAVMILLFVTSCMYGLLYNIELDVFLARRTYIL